MRREPTIAAVDPDVLKLAHQIQADEWTRNGRLLGLMRCVKIVLDRQHAHPVGTIPAGRSNGRVDEASSHGRRSNF